LQSGHPLVTVNDQIAIGLVGYSDNHNRCLLARRGERSQQSPLLFGMLHPQMLPGPIELMKLQSHGGDTYSAPSFL
jgi:hypothetical protein